VEYRKWPFALRARLGEPAGAALADVFEERDSRVLNLMTERYERRLVEECAKIRVELAGARADFIKWSFLFWIGQAATVAALFVALR
jgi:hypothetical protein